MEAGQCRKPAGNPGYYSSDQTCRPLEAGRPHTDKAGDNPCRWTDEESPVNKVLMPKQNHAQGRNYSDGQYGRKRAPEGRVPVKTMLFGDAHGLHNAGRNR